jgi:hypothetical protein
LNSFCVFLGNCNISSEIGSESMSVCMDFLLLNGWFLPVSRSFYNKFLFEISFVFYPRTICLSEYLLLNFSLNIQWFHSKLTGNIILVCYKVHLDIISFLIKRPTFGTLDVFRSFVDLNTGLIWHYYSIESWLVWDRYTYKCFWFSEPIFSISPGGDNIVYIIKFVFNSISFSFSFLCFCSSPYHATHVWIRFFLLI